MSADPLDTVAAPVRVESEVKGSRFIGDLVPVVDLAAADAAIVAARREFSDARHHCTALVIGPDGARQRSNDDGEPSGTAGAPMLAVLRGARLTDVVVVVTRYFGGTLLGTGGLARAYGGAVTDAVAAATRLRRRTVRRVAVHTRHEDAGRLEHRLRIWAGARGQVEVAPGTYDAEGARFELALLPEASDALHTLLAEDGGAVHLDELGTALRRSPVDGA
ncbi:YigZ family protein [Egicoccus halophilus]|uniref:YigZ family protein n=1 Tax=Egicoccus halophilus TaxID=1670830 RepID=UPI001031F5C2|nr:YigZ family protein [Egicoccus halophilus]